MKGERMILFMAWMCCIGLLVVMVRHSGTQWDTRPQPGTQDPRRVSSGLVRTDLRGQQETTLVNDALPFPEEATTVAQDTGGTANNAQEQVKKKKTLVLLLSSTGRSGSTFLGELLATYDNTIYFFEPLHKVKSEPCINDTTCVLNYVTDKFMCTFNEEFKTWLKAHGLFHMDFSAQMNVCDAKRRQSRTKCIDDIDVWKECRDADVVLIKLIRARTRTMDPLLNNSEINFKVVHLYRDPRGFMNSIYHMAGFNRNISYMCSTVKDDLLYFNSVYMQHPTQMIQVSYEQICLDPIGNTQRLFEFLYGIKELPEQTIQYINTHTKDDSQPGGMTRVRDSSVQYQKWRDTINQSLLEGIEKDPDCRLSMDMMRHRVFGSMDIVRNKNISMFL